MSRIGKQPIVLPEGVKVELKPNHLLVKGNKGSLETQLHPDISVNTEAGLVKVSRPTDQKRHRALHGLYRALIHNMVVGVSQGYTKTLELVGVGYKANANNNVLELSLGYSHPIFFQMPEEVKVTTETPKGRSSTSHPKITLESIDKELLGKVAAKVRSLRKVEPYKGKGIRYANERVRRKAGKTAKGAG